MIDREIESLLSEEEKKLFTQLKVIATELNTEVYAVGGFVRDKLLGINSKDIDFVCIGDVNFFVDRFKKRFYPTIVINSFKNFGTVNMRLQNLEIEFVNARKESYSLNSRNPLVELGSFNDDQCRRDFTINTLAIDIKNNFKLIDTFNGVADLKNKIIKTPINPDKVFFDDPLRILRAIRFACKFNFIIEEKTFNSIIKNVDRLSIISMERIAGELNKIILLPQPSIGFLLLDKINLLKIILPELTNLKGVDIINNLKHKNNFYHSLKVLDNISAHTNDLWLRWAALLHDIGKSKVKKFEPNIGWTFHGHEIISAQWINKIFTRLRLPLNEKLNYVKKIIALHHRPVSLTKDNITDSAVRRLIFDAGNEIDDLMLLCEADITSKNKIKIQQYLSNFFLVKERMKIVQQKDEIRNWHNPITGEEIIKTFNLKPSRLVGDIKDQIKDAILDGLIPNDYEHAYKFMLEIGKKMNLI